jgi:hypothetical protein
MAATSQSGAVDASTKIPFSNSVYKAHEKRPLALCLGPLAW